MNDLALFRQGNTWGVALGPRRRCQVLVRWKHQPSGEITYLRGHQPGPMVWLATGPAIHDLLRHLGIFDHMVALLAARICDDFTTMERIHGALNLEAEFTHGYPAKMPPWHGR